MSSRRVIRSPRGGPAGSRGAKGKLQADPCITEAANAYAGKRYDEAISLYQRARKHDPSNPSLIIALGQSYGMAGKHDEAKRCFSKALKLKPHRADLHLLVGNALHEMRLRQQALEYYQTAQHLDPQSTDPPIAAGLLYERMGELDAARDAAEQALAIDGDFGPAQLLAAMVLRRQGELAEAEAKLRRLLNATDVDDETCAKAYYELAHVLDRQGKYDRAMEALERAKAVKKRYASRHKPMQLPYYDLRSAQLERWTAQAPPRDGMPPLALLGGHPRSGTTLIEQVLDTHPQLISAEETSVMVSRVHDAMRRDTGVAWLPDVPLAPILDALDGQELASLRRAYRLDIEKTLDESTGDRILLDKNPELTSYIPTILRVFPETKLIIALRDPRDVCLSCFMQPLPLNWISVHFLTLERTVERYIQFMNNWISLREQLKSPWIEVRYEDAVYDLAGTAQKLTEFLGLTWDERVLAFDQHIAGKFISSPSYQSVAQPVYRAAIGRWRHYEKHFEPLLTRLSPLVKELGYEP